MTPFIDCWFL